jgi:hypothetical protein
MANDLFFFINTFFKPTEFNKISMYERGKYFFMVNRLCAIAYPVQASYFNHLKIAKGQVVTFWQNLLGSKYHRTPKWMDVKTKKAKETKKKKTQPVSDDTIRKYCETYKISRREVKEGLQLLGEPFEKELKNFETLITQ